jgi:ketosteroid isomerase-like protein
VSINAELTRDAYAALNSGDFEWLVEHSDPSIEMRFRGVAGEPVLYVGAEGIREYFHDMAEIWDSIEYFPETIHDLGDRTVTVVRRRLRGKHSGLTLEDTIACACELRSGLVSQVCVYRDVDEALAR